MGKPKIDVILGSIRSGRAGVKVAKWFMETIKEEASEAELVDLLEFPLPLFADEVLPGMREGKHADPAVQKWLDKIMEADGYVIITAEYNHGIPSALKNALDYGYKEWNGKPVGFVSYGGEAGGARAVEQLREVVAELKMYSVRDQVVISWVGKAFDEKGNLQNAEAHAKNAHLMLDTVIKLATKLRS